LVTPVSGSSLSALTIVVGGRGRETAVEKQARKGKELVGGVSYLDDAELEDKGITGCDGTAVDPKRLIIIFKPEG